MRILIVEDEPVLVVALARGLQTAGHKIAATTGSLAGALAAIATVAFDVAVLDIILRGQSAEPVAAALKTISIPFVATSGYDEKSAGAFAGAPFLAKPFSIDALLAVLQKLIITPPDLVRPRK